MAHERVFFSHISAIFHVLCTQQRHIEIFFSFFIFHCTLKTTPETNSTTFILAAKLQTKNKLIDDLGKRNRVIPL
jgi:hypothetical protein